MSIRSTIIVIPIISTTIMIATTSKIIIVFEVAAAPLTCHPSLALHHRGDPTKVKFEAVVMVVGVGGGGEGCDLVRFPNPLATGGWGT